MRLFVGIPCAAGIALAAGRRPGGSGAPPKQGEEFVQEPERLGARTVDGAKQRGQGVGLGAARAASLSSLGSGADGDQVKELLVLVRESRFSAGATALYHFVTGFWVPTRAPSYARR